MLAANVPAGALTDVSTSASAPRRRCASSAVAAAWSQCSQAPASAPSVWSVPDRCPPRAKWHKQSTVGPRALRQILRQRIEQPWTRFGLALSSSTDLGIAFSRQLACRRPRLCYTCFRAWILRQHTASSRVRRSLCCSPNGSRASLPASNTPIAQMLPPRRPNR